MGRGIEEYQGWLYLPIVVWRHNYCFFTHYRFLIKWLVAKKQLNAELQNPDNQKALLSVRTTNIEKLKVRVKDYRKLIIIFSLIFTFFIIIVLLFRVYLNGLTRVVT